MLYLSLYLLRIDSKRHIQKRARAKECSLCIRLIGKQCKISTSEVHTQPGKPREGLLLMYPHFANFFLLPCP